jgi:hypothetical protein
MAGQGHERPRKAPCHEFNETRLPAAGRALEHHGGAVGMSRFK